MKLRLCFDINTILRNKESFKVANVVMTCVDETAVMAIYYVCYIETIPADTKRWRVGNVPIKSEGHCISKFRPVC